MELNHNRSALVLDSGMVCAVTTLHRVYQRSLNYGPWAQSDLQSRDEHGSGLTPILAGSGLDRTAIFLKIGGSGLDRTEKIFVVLM